MLALSYGILNSTFKTGSVRLAGTNASIGTVKGFSTQRLYKNSFVQIHSMYIEAGHRERRTHIDTASNYFLHHQAGNAC